MTWSFELPAFLRPAACVDLVRLGREGDGGYVVSRRSIGHADRLLSLGVNDDWSFEAACLAHHDVPLVCVDGSVTLGRFAGEARMEALRAARAALSGRLTDARLNVREFRRLRGLHNSLTDFFRPDSRRLISEYIGPEEWGRYSWQVLRRNLSSATFLKMDIEGAEYRVLDALAGDAGRLTGLVAEFHDVDLLLDRIRRFCEHVNSELALVHVHANNCLEPIRGSAIPSAIELTWVRRILLEESEQSVSTHGALPIAGLDRANDPSRSDFQLVW